MKYDLAKVWRRVAALVIDLFLVGILGGLLGHFFGDYFIELGSNGIWIGFFIGLAYFSILNSSVAGGQTIGKKIMKLMVVGEDDQGLPLLQAIVRAVVLLLPYFLLDYSIPGTSETSLMHLAKSLGCSCALVGFAMVYFLNESTRQSLHDLLVKSYVVRNKEAFSIVDEPFAKPLVESYVYYAYAGVAVLLLSISVYTYSQQDQPSEQVALVASKLENQAGVYHSAVAVTKTTSLPFFLPNNTDYEMLQVKLDVSNLPKDTDNSAEIKKNKVVRNSIRVILNNYSEVDSLNTISLQLNKGYNIGIAKSSELAYMSKTPEEWREMFDIKAVAKPTKH